MIPMNAYDAAMHSNHELDLRAVDLNLLIVLDALLRTESVTEAARHLGRTQSAVSHALGRLRDLLDDPLFVRAGRGMTPTPRALEMKTALRAVLVDVERVLLQPSAFDPTTSHRVFRFACPDLFEALVLPKLLATLAENAPHVGVVAMPVRGYDALARLLSGELDAVALPVPEGSPSPAPGELRTHTVLRDTLVAFLRRGHPALAHGPLSLDAYCDAAHVMVTQVGRGPGPVDDALASMGRARTIRARVRSFLTTPHLLAATDLILTGPASLRALMPEGIVDRAPPVALPGHRLELLWHPRQHADDGHSWFREQIADALHPASSSQQPGPIPH